MIKPSHSASHRAPLPPRNRWISPRQVKVLESLWSARMRRAGRRPQPGGARAEQLRHIAETVGRTVASLRELTWREANRVLRRLLEEVRSSGPPLAPPHHPSLRKGGRRNHD